MIYALFAFDDYYPAGGMGDAVAVFDVADDEAAVERAVEAMRHPNAHDRASLPHYDHVDLVRLEDGKWTDVDLPREALR